MQPLCEESFSEFHSFHSKKYGFFPKGVYVPKANPPDRSIPDLSLVLGNFVS